jgi:hypothetical protein
MGYLSENTVICKPDCIDCSQSLICNTNTTYLSSFKIPDFAFQIRPIVLTHHVLVVREVMTVKVKEALVM